jgi:hypothetical protein
MAHVKILEDRLYTLERGMFGRVFGHLTVRAGAFIVTLECCGSPVESNEYVDTTVSTLDDRKADRSFQTLQMALTVANHELEKFKFSKFMGKVKAIEAEHDQQAE